MNAIRLNCRFTSRTALSALCLASIACTSTQHTTFFRTAAVFEQATDCTASGGGSAGCCHATCEQIRAGETADSERRRYGFAVIEFDDHGDFRDPKQLTNALDLIDVLRRPVLDAPRDRGLTLVLFTHGWKHYPTDESCTGLFEPDRDCFTNPDAEGCDPERDCHTDLQRFRFFLELLNDHPQMEDRELMGVFLSWRGAVFERDGTGNGIVNPAAWAGQQLSFWSRASAAEKVAGENYVRAVNQLILAGRRADCVPRDPPTPGPQQENPEADTLCAAAPVDDGAGMDGRVIPLSVACSDDDQGTHGKLVVPDVSVIAIGHSFGGKIVELALGSSSITSALASSPAAERARWQARIWGAQADRSCSEAREHRCLARRQRETADACTADLQRAWHALDSGFASLPDAPTLPSEPPESSPGSTARPAWESAMLQARTRLASANETLSDAQAAAAELQATREARRQAIEEGLDQCRQRIDELEHVICRFDRTLETAKPAFEAESPCRASRRAREVAGACELEARSTNPRERLLFCVRCGISTWEEFVLELGEDPAMTPGIRQALGSPEHRVPGRTEANAGDLSEPTAEEKEADAKVTSSLAVLGREGNRLRGSLAAIRLPPADDPNELDKSKRRIEQAQNAVREAEAVVGRLVDLEKSLLELDRLADVRRIALDTAQRFGDEAKAGVICSTRWARTGHRELARAVSPVADLTLLVNPASPALTTRAVSDALTNGTLADTLNGERYRLARRPWLISLSSPKDWATLRLFPLGTKLGNAFAHFNPGQKELATTTGPHHPGLVNLEMVHLEDAEQPFPDDEPLTEDGITLDRCVEGDPGRCGGPQSGYWIVNVDGGLNLITGHNSVFSRKMMEVYLGLLNVARSFEPIDPGELDPHLAQMLERHLLCSLDGLDEWCPGESAECRP